MSKILPHISFGLAIIIENLFFFLAKFFFEQLKSNNDKTGIYMKRVKHGIGESKFVLINRVF